MELDISAVKYRQNLFCSALKSHFHRKITKYQNVLLKNGIHLSEQNCSTDDILALPRSQSFEDHIELVIGQKTASPNAWKAFLKIGNRISTIKLFRWIFLIVQRTKAARILHHLDGISDTEIQAVIQSVGQEIAVAFEYQLCLLEGDFEIVKLAQHAGSCILTYLNSADAHYAPENLLQAVLEVKPKKGTNKEILRTRTLYFNSQPVCLKWRLRQVLKQPGLRIINDGSTVSKNPRPSHNTEQLTSNIQQNTSTSQLTQTNTIEAETIGEQTLVRGIELHTDHTDKMNDIHTLNCDDMEDDHETDNGECSSAQNKLKFRRRISEVDMDYDKGELKVTEHSVEVSDFSPIENDTSELNDGESTSIDEDMDSESDFEDASGNISNKSENELPKDIFNGDVTSTSCKTTPEGKMDYHMNNTLNAKNCIVTADTDNKNSPEHILSKTTGLLNTQKCYEHDLMNTENIFIVHHETGAPNNEIQHFAIHDSDVVGENKPGMSTKNISAHQPNLTKQDESTYQSEYLKQTTRTHHSVQVTQTKPTNQTLTVSQNTPTDETVDVTKPASTKQTTDVTQTKSPQQPAFTEPTNHIIQQPPPVQQDQIIEHITLDSSHDQQGSQVCESERAKPNQHITANTYQSSLEQSSSITTNEADTVNCDIDSLNELTIDENSYSFYGCFTPYGAKCRPKIYGYRGPLHVWNETSKQYTLIYNDTVTVARKHRRQVMHCRNDFHQRYIPKTVCQH